MNYDQIKFDICCAARMLYRQGLSVANAGHLSVAVGENTMLVNHFGPSFATLKPENIIELGSSLGISSAYLSTGSPSARLVSFEGAPEIAKLARDNFSSLGLTNVNLVEGNFDNTLSTELQKLPYVDLAFIDGNHRKEPTIRYFKQFLGKIT